MTERIDFFDLAESGLYHVETELLGYGEKPPILFTACAVGVFRSMKLAKWALRNSIAKLSEQNHRKLTVDGYSYWLIDGNFNPGNIQVAVFCTEIKGRSLFFSNEAQARVDLIPRIIYLSGDWPLWHRV